MNGTTGVPASAFQKLQEQGAELVLGMDNGVVWTIQGKSMAGANADVNFGVKQGVSDIPIEVLDKVTSNTSSVIQFRLAHQGDFGFQAMLTMPSNPAWVDKYARLYYYNTSTGALDLTDLCKVSKSGDVSFAFGHASSYAIVIEDVHSAAVPEKSQQVFHKAEPPKPEPKQYLPVIVMLFILLFIIVVAVVAGKNKKKKAQAAKREQARRAQAKREQERRKR